MTATNVEEMEQLLKDLAANIGYELIPNPFGTPFEEASLEKLPDDKQFIWPIPASVLRDDAHKEFRKIWKNADLIDTVSELSWTWPSSTDDRMVILLIDLTRSRRGTVKLVNATDWDIRDDWGMAAVCNLLIHDLFPGIDQLAFQQIDEDSVDLYLDERWNELVCLLSIEDIKSLLPSDNIFRLEQHLDMETIPHFFDIWTSEDTQPTMKLEKSAVVISTMGALNPTKIEYKGEPITLSLKDKMVLIPDVEDCFDLERVVEMLGKEEVLRQLPITRRILYSDMGRVRVDCKEFLKVSVEEMRKRWVDSFMHKFKEKNDNNTK